MLTFTYDLPSRVLANYFRADCIIIFEEKDYICTIDPKRSSLNFAL